MPDVTSPRSNNLRPADPERRNDDNASAARVFVVMVASLTVAALLNAPRMLERAETSPLGPGRDRALAFWRPVGEVSSAVGLDRPRAGLEALRGDDTAIPGPDPGGASTAAPGPDPLGHAPVPTTPHPLGPRTASGDDQASDDQASDDQASGAGPPGPATPLDLLSSPFGPAPTPPEAPSTTTHPTTGFPLRRPTVADPLRVLVIGDSTAEPVGTSTLRILEGTGVSDASLDYRVSTGLARPDFFDWPVHLAAVQAERHHEVVVVMLGANDAQAFVVGDEVVELGSQAWTTEYRRRVDALLDQLTSGGGWVIWVGQPRMRRADFDERIARIDGIHREATAGRATVRYVDTRALLSEDGAYTAYLPDSAGDRRLVRQDDGIHLSPGGGEVIAPVVVDLIDSIAPLR